MPYFETERIWINSLLNSARILDFDIETQLVGFHKGGKFNPDGCRPVIISWSWMDEEEVYTREVTGKTLEEFRTQYDKADVVTGHYIRKFDLPIINMRLLELHKPRLNVKIAWDTKADLIPFGGASKSQENMSAMLGLQEEKYHMSDTDWRNMDKDMKKKVMERNAQDVIQHKEMFRKLGELEYLSKPKEWGR